MFKAVVVAVVLFLIAFSNGVSGRLLKEENSSSCRFRVAFTYDSGDLLSTELLGQEVGKLVAKTYDDISECAEPLYDSSSCYMTIVGGVVDKACNVAMVFVCNKPEGSVAACGDLDDGRILGKKLKLDKDTKAKVTDVDIDDYGSAVGYAVA